MVGMLGLGRRLSNYCPTKWWSNKWWCSRHTSADQTPTPCVPVKAPPGLKPKGRVCEERMLRRSKTEQASLAWAALTTYSRIITILRRWSPASTQLVRLALPYATKYEISSLIYSPETRLNWAEGEEWVTDKPSCLSVMNFIHKLLRDCLY